MLSAVNILAWLSTLLFSILPDMLFSQLIGAVPQWLFAAKLGLIAFLLMLSLFWKPAQNLQRYFLVFLAIFLTQRGWRAVAESSQWQAWFPVFETGIRTGFQFQMLGVQLGRLAIALAIIAALYVIGFHRKEAFLDAGDLVAPAAPAPFIGVDQPTTWRSLGLRLGGYTFIALLVILSPLFLFSGSGINGDALSIFLPAFPIVLLLAAMNSLSEEVTYRAALLAPTIKVLGSGQAVWLTAVFFGIGHMKGVPGGVFGALATGFFGWILGRSMLETKGIFWPWFIHLCADVAVFSFLAIGALQFSS